MRTIRRLAAVGATAALAITGAACAQSDGGSTSPGQEAPDDLTGGGTTTDGGAGAGSGAEGGGLGTGDAGTTP